jgi:D-inositol-3-phosphate glycosyltransferase
MGMEIKAERDQSSVAKLSDVAGSGRDHQVSVTLLTGGGDRPYVFGLAQELIAKGAEVDLIGSDELDFPEFHGKPKYNFINLRGDQRPQASLLRKALRVLQYYVRLIGYAAAAKPKVFHILWNNKFQLFDRTLLMAYYRALGKRIVLTSHNINIGRRDSKDTFVNRLTLRIQYLLAHHTFVHTEKMKRELIGEFDLPESRITVIPFGINNAVPNTSLTPREARQRLDIRANEKVILFFGNIAPYKGLEYLVSAFQQITVGRDDYRLIIAGRPKGPMSYWPAILEAIREDVQKGRVLLRADYIPDEETEIYFKAADVLVLPYRHVYQSGVLFLGYSFGLPTLASDVGSLRDDILEGSTGFIFKPEDSMALAKTIEAYFASDLYANLDARRQQIREYAAQHHSWEIVGEKTLRVYADLAGGFPSGNRS